MNISSYLDAYQMPPEVFQRFLIPLSYEKTLKHCQAYYQKNNILVCSKDLWIKKVKKVSIKERQQLLNDAVRNGYVFLVQALLEDENVDPSDGDSVAIRLAAQYGYTNIVKLLLADPRVDPSAQNNNAIIFAAMRGYSNIVTSLLIDSRVDPSSDDNYAIRWAAENGNTDIVKLLLADPRVDPSDHDSEAIKWAALNGHVDVVKLLLADPRVDPSAKNNQAVIRAADKGYTNIIRLLFYWYSSYSKINKIMNIIDISDIYLSVALKFACYHQNYDNVKLLLEMGADRRVQSNYCQRISAARKDIKMLKLLIN